MLILAVQGPEINQEKRRNVRKVKKSAKSFERVLNDLGYRMQRLVGFVMQSGYMTWTVRI